MQFKRKGTMNPPCTEIYIHHELALSVGLIPALVLDIIRRQYDLARRYPLTPSYGILYDRKTWARIHAADIYEKLAGSITLKSIYAIIEKLEQRDLILTRTDPKNERIHYITFSPEFTRHNSAFFDLPEHVY